jgi:hypothetical protein
MSNLRKKHKRKAKRPLKIGVVFFSVFAAINIFMVFFSLSFFMFVLDSIDMFMKDLPQIEEFSPALAALTSKVYAADGTLIATFHGEENRELVSIDDIPCPSGKRAWNENCNVITSAINKNIRKDNRWIMIHMPLILLLKKCGKDWRAGGKSKNTGSPFPKIYGRMRQGLPENIQ